jgi:hypothetical protein
MNLFNKPNKKRMVFWGLLMVLALALMQVSAVSAHENITIGEYVVEYGWFSEPAVAGQPNAVVINIAPVGADAPADMDVSTLKIQAVFGDLDKVLELQPLGEDTPGQFIAPITPMRPGSYTIHLSGMVGSTSFENDVVPEEVKTADVVQFPFVDPNMNQSAASTSLGLTGWLAIGGLVFGILGTLLAVISLLRKPSRG